MTGSPSPASGHSALSGWEISDAHDLDLAAASRCGGGRPAASGACGLAGRPRGRLGERRAPGRRRRLGLDLAGRLVLAQALEGGLAHHAVARSSRRTRSRRRAPACVQVTPGLLARGADAGEGRLCRRHRLQPRQKRSDLGRADSRCRRGRHRRSARRDGRRPAASGSAHWSSIQPPMTTSWPARHLAFVQVSLAAGAIGRIEPLRDDAFERQAAGGSQHGVAAGLEMLDEANRRALRRAGFGQDGCEARLALGQRPGAPVARRRSNSRSKAKKTRSSVSPSDSAACSAAKSGAPCVVERARSRRR